MSNEMSNEHTHDPQEPTGARLTDEQIGSLRRYAAEWSAFDAQHMKPTHILSNGVLDLLADRAALVAEVARLQGDTNRNGAVLASVRYVLAATRAQNAEMRPLVEALAGGEATEYYGIGTEDTNCNLCSGREDRQTGHVVHEADCPVTHARALVATWATGQTPAAPTPDGAIIIPDDPREQARIQREIILDSGVDFAEHYAGLVDDPTDDDDAPTPDGQEGGDDDVC